MHEWGNSQPESDHMTSCIPLKLPEDPSTYSNKFDALITMLVNYKGILIVIVGSFFFQHSNKFLRIKSIMLT